MEQETQLKGLTIYVYRPAALGDCTNHGITSTADRLTVVGILDLTDARMPVDEPLPRACLINEAHDGAPAVVLVKRQFGDDCTWSIRPYETRLQHSMFGGNFAASSDSRFGQLIGFYGAVAVHDRYERLAS